MGLFDFFNKFISIDTMLKHATQNPNSAEAWYACGVYYTNSGNFQKAIEYYDKTLQLKRDYVEALINRAGSYGMIGEYSKAIRDYDSAINIDSRCSDAYFNRGISYARAGNEAKALEDIGLSARLGYKQAQDFLRSEGITW
jgi:tetratricopeptide (TPR) repeat protein